MIRIRDPRTGLVREFDTDDPAAAKQQFRAGGGRPVRRDTEPRQEEISRQRTFPERVEARKQHGEPLPFLHESAATGGHALGRALESGHIPFASGTFGGLGEAAVPRTYGGLAAETTAAAVGGRPVTGTLSETLPFALRTLLRGLRIGAPAAAGGGTAALAGEPIGPAVGTGAVGGAFGELGEKVGSVATRRLGTALNTRDIEQVAQAIERVAPDVAARIRGVRTASELQDVMAHPFQEALSDAYRQRLGNVVGQFERGWAQAGQPVTAGPGGVPRVLVDVPALKAQQQPLTDVLEKLRILRQGGWISGVTREGMSGAEKRALYDEAMDQVNALIGGVSPVAQGMFKEMRDVYRPGARLGDLFQETKPSTLYGGGRLNMDALRDAFAELQQYLQRDLAPGAYAALHRALFRGAGSAERDLPQQIIPRTPMGVSGHPPAMGPFRAWLYSHLPRGTPTPIGAVPRRYAVGGYPTRRFAIPTMALSDTLRGRQPEEPPQ